MHRSLGLAVVLLTALLLPGARLGPALEAGARVAAPGQDSPGWWTPLMTPGVEMGEVRGAPNSATLWVTSRSLAYASEDGGTTWATLAGERLWPSAVIPSPVHPGVLFTRTAKSVLWRSRDAGQTWTSLTLPMSTAKWQFMFDEPIICADGRLWVRLDYFASDTRFWAQLAYSDDDGETWTLVPHEFQQSARFLMSPADSRRVWMSDVHGTVRTDDAGLTWSERLVDFPTFPVIVDWADANRLWSIGFDGFGSNYPPRLVRSTDAGLTWDRLDAVPAGQRVPPKVTFDYTRPGRLYLVREPISERETGVFVSEDGGDTWRSYPLAEALQRQPINVVSAPAGGGGAVFIALPTGLFRSQDDGATWELMGGFNARQFQRVFSAGGHLVAWTMPGIWLPPSTNPSHPNATSQWASDDGGQTWVPQPAALGPGDLAVQDPQQPLRLLSVSGGEHAARSLDGGQTWQPTASAPAGLGYPRALVLDPSTPNRVWLGGTNTPQTRNGPVHPLLWRSDDFGDTWETVAGEGGPSQIIWGLAVDPTNPNRLYVAGERLFRSEDGGVTWTALAPEAEAVVSVLVDPLDPHTIWLGTLQHGLGVSRDDGATWQWGFLSRFDVAVRLFAHPTNPRLFYAAAVSPGLYQLYYNSPKLPPAVQATLHRTADGGRTWQAITGPLDRVDLGSGQLYLNLPRDYPDQLYVAGDGGSWIYHDPAGACRDLACVNSR